MKAYTPNGAHGKELLYLVVSSNVIKDKVLF